jgi:hypothetical protein
VFWGCVVLCCWLIGRTSHSLCIADLQLIWFRRIGESSAVLGAGIPSLVYPSVSLSIWARCQSAAYILILLALARAMHGWRVLRAAGGCVDRKCRANVKIDCLLAENDCFTYQ